MMAAINPNVISQHRAPISKSALSFIAYLRIPLGGPLVGREPAAFVNTQMAGDQNCHSSQQKRWKRMLTQGQHGD